MRGIQGSLWAIAIVASLVIGGPVGAACDTGVEVVISEFMALNTRTLADEDLDYSDWIELYNPCVEDVDLGGWYLTDDPDDLTRWQFPTAHLKRGEFAVVFASGKNRAVAGGQLHTSFKLDAEGEYLALVRPDGVTIEQQFAPLYPPQVADYSYGLAQRAFGLVDRDSPARYRIPTVDDAGLGDAWAGRTFDDAAWSPGSAAIGFTSAPPTAFEVTNYKALTTVNSLGVAEAVIADPLLQAAVYTESAPVVNYLNSAGAGHFTADRPFPGMNGVTADDFVVEATAKVVIPTAGSWTFGVNSDDGFSLRLSREPYDFTMQFPGTRGPGDTFAVFQIPEAGVYDLRLVYFERGGGSEVELFAAAGSFTTYSSVFRLVGDGASGGLELASIASRIATDVRAPMHGNNASAWLRIPFDVADPVALDLAVLRAYFEDGFVAYLNGTEVARSNAAGPVAWDSAALADRGDDLAAIAEPIDLSEWLALLEPGANVLAIHGLNDAAANDEFLIAPELDVAEETDAGVARYFEDPSPGGFNDAGHPGVAGVPSFSAASSLFVDPFSLTLATTSPTATIRYTTDRTEPSESNGTTYSGPISISNSAVVRARVFDAELAPGPVITRMYARLAAAILDVDSNLPLVVGHTFGGAVNQDWLTEGLTAFIPTSGGRAAITATPAHIGPTGIRYRGSSSFSFPKKSYFLETWDDNRDDLDVALLGMPAESDWILYGPYTDKSLMRDVLAYKWSNDAGRYAVRTRFVEMYLRTASGMVTSSDYVGVYVLMEKIKQGPARVAIADLDPTDAVAPGITGGYITKKDRLDPGDQGFLTSRGQRLAYFEPKEQEITTVQADWLRNYYNTFETALYGPSFTDPITGYAAYIDPDSWIDQHLLVEMTKNIDGYRLSTFMFKDRSQRLNMGPAWDFNLTLGNANYLEGWLPEGWYYPQLGANDYPWWPRLNEDPEYRQRYADRWYELRRGPWRTDRLVADIETYAALLDEAQARNYQRWPILGTYVWPNWYIAPTYADEVAWMRQWLTDRVAWMDAQFAAPPTFNHAGGLVPLYFDLQMSAPVGTVYYTLDGTDPRLTGGGIAPGATAYSGPIAILDTTRVRARAFDGMTWSAIADETFVPSPIGFVNEIQALNVTVRRDEAGEFEPWIELYNPFPATVDFGGMHVSDDPGHPLKWEIPAGTTVCGGQWLLIWADAEPSEGPLHAGFELNPAGGQVVLTDAQGRVHDSVAYPALAANVSYGRTPDGGPVLVDFLYATPKAKNSQLASRVVVNEYNGVATDRMLGGTGTDAFFGRVPGNGGDWFELVTIEDHLDLRGWQVRIDDAIGPTSTTLTFTSDPLLSDLRSGTIVTVAEDLAGNPSYDAEAGDWWIHLRSGPFGDGTYIDAQDFTTSHQSTQITVLDAGGAVAFGPAGEGVQPLTGVGSDEVWKLEADPGPSTTALANFKDGTSSTFGAPNLWSAGTISQNLEPLRAVVVSSCDGAEDCFDANPCTDDVCVDGSCDNPSNAAPCDDGDPCTSGDVCTSRQCRGEPVAGCCFGDCECEDGLFCTALDVCSGNACTYVPRNCSDADACTSDSCRESGCEHVVNGLCAISGTVRYYRDSTAGAEPSSKTVRDIPVDKTSDGVPDAITDSAGAYTFPGLSGSVTVEALDAWGSPRALNHGGAISSFDAVQVALHVVQSTTLSVNQRVAGDVTGNGSLSSLDAARIAQFAVELIDHFDVATAQSSDWSVLRCSKYNSATDLSCTTPVYVHDYLSGPVTDNFFAILYGEVTGNWTAPSAGLAPSAVAAGESAVAAEDRAEADRLRSAGVRRSTFPEPSAGATLTLSGWKPPFTAGTEQVLTLSVKDGDGLEALDLTVAFDPAVQVLSVRPVGLGSSFRVLSNGTSGGHRIAMFTTVPMRGSGPLLEIRVRVDARRPAPPRLLRADANEGLLRLWGQVLTR